MDQDPVGPADPGFDLPDRRVFMDHHTGITGSSGQTVEIFERLQMAGGMIDQPPT